MHQYIYIYIVHDNTNRGRKRLKPMSILSIKTRILDAYFKHILDIRVTCKLVFRFTINWSFVCGVYIYRHIAVLVIYQSLLSGPRLINCYINRFNRIIIYRETVDFKR